jgi:hypothetical protein
MRRAAGAGAETRGHAGNGERWACGHAEAWKNDPVKTFRVMCGTDGGLKTLCCEKARSFFGGFYSKHIII